MNKKLREILIFGTKKLNDKNINSAILDAELLLSCVLKKPREFLFTYPDFELNKKQIEKYKSLIKKRSTHYPIAYILGYKEFYNLKFLVNENVLIPRPETELLINSTFEVANLRGRILEIGTGSGCISIALAKNGFKNIIATDISLKALNLARKNSELNKIDEISRRARDFRKIKFIKSDLLDKVKNEEFDIIIANLPYLSNDYKKEKSIRFEPKLALYSRKKGLEHYQKLFQEITELKHQPKYILIELNPEQIPDLSLEIKKLWPKAKIQIKKDLQGIDRVMVIKLPHPLPTGRQVALP